MATIFTQNFYSGDCIPFTVQFFQSDNVTPLDLTGQTVSTTIKNNATDPDTAALFYSKVAGGTTGIINFLVPGFTSGNPTLAAGTYAFDVKRWDTTGCRYNAVATQLIILQSVTARQTP